MKFAFINLFLLSSLFFTSNSFGQSWKWAHEVGGPSSDGWLIRADAANNIITSGVNTGDTIVYGTHKIANPLFLSSYRQTVVAKYDASGNVLWAAGSQNGNSMPFGLTTDPNNNIYVYGIFASDSITFGSFTAYDTLSGSSFPYKYFLVKYDSAGNVIWMRTGGNVYSSYLDPSLNGLSSDASSNLYIVGSFVNATMLIGTTTLTNADNSGSTADIFIAKYDASGNVVWAKRAGGNADDIGSVIDARPNGDIYVSGTFRSTSLQMGNASLSNGSNIEVYIAKLDAAGNGKWIRGASQQNVNLVGPKSITTDASWNVYVAGIFGDSLKFGSNGVFNYNLSSINGFVVKYDSAGNSAWAKSIGANSNYDVQAYALTTDACNNIWMTGEMSNNMVVDGHSLNEPSGGVDPLFITGWSSTGTYISTNILTTGGDDAAGLAADNAGYIYLHSDNYLYNVPFVIGSFTLNNTGQEQIFVAKYGPTCSSAGVNEEVLSNEIVLYPNPARDQFTVKYSGAQNASIALYNLTGQLVLSSPLKDNTTVISTSSLSAGMYMCRIVAEGQAAVTKKILIEK